MKCGNCTACCTMLLIEALDKPANTPCKYCDQGCTIYDTKPETCTEFECAYLQGKNVPETLRPDNCGIIFIKKTDRIFSGILVAGKKVTDAAKHQITSFNEQGYSVILVSVNENAPLLMPAKDHCADEIMKEYKDNLDGNLQH